MKFPKETKRYCPYCKKHTLVKISTVSQKVRSSVRPLSRGGKFRLKARGLTSGTGNKGKYNKPPIAKWKRKSKVTKRITIMYKCKECGKGKGIKKAIRSGRIEIGEKVAK